MTRPYRRWTNPENAIICEMTAAGVAITEIATRLGRTSQSVESQKRKLGLCVSPQKLPPAIVETVIDRFESGEMKTRIARDLGISLSSVSRVILNNGAVNRRSVSSMRRNPIQSRTVALHEMRREGLSIAEISRRTGADRRSITNAILRVERQIAALEEAA